MSSFNVKQGLSVGDTPIEIIDATGKITSPDVYSTTTAVVANVAVDSNGRLTRATVGGVTGATGATGSAGSGGGSWGSKW